MLHTQSPAPSPNPADALRRQLATLVPEAFSEGRLDVAALKRTLGESALIEGGERYALDWAGKSDAYRVLQTPSFATLRPQRDTSENFDAAQHVFIEGENLEVLKILQKAYFGKIKLIYIDPPYNTGSDSFIYPDRFAESKEDYLRRIDDLDDDGTLMREGAFRKNSRENGHYHSNWLSMMLPRLYIARNLLRDDGVIFVSIDDNEVHNLRCLMGEVFGEENFLGAILWKKKTNGNNMGVIPPVHDYIISYARNAENVGDIGYEVTEEYVRKTYSNPDNDPRGAWTTMDLSANHKGPHFPVENPVTKEVFYPPEGRYWVFNEKEVKRRIADGRIIFGKNGTKRPVQKVFASDRMNGKIRAESWWDSHGMNEDATTEIRNFFGQGKLFTHPKPSKLIANIVKIATDDDDIVMDFFAGSASTAHAVMQANAEDGSNRRFVMVQLPEPCDEDSSAFKAGYKTIADISRERIRRVIGTISEAADPAADTANLGFKSFLLTPSNFRLWRGDGIDTPEDLAEQIQLFAKSEKAGAATENILFELLLKFGQPLTASIDVLDVAGSKVYAINQRSMLFVLEDFHMDMVFPLVDMQPKPQEIIAIDSVFSDSDMLKNNLELQCRDAGIRFTCL